MDVELAPISVLFVRAEGGASGAKEAFDKLESRLGGHKGRRFYGTYDPMKREYRACVERAQVDDPASMNLETWTIPGGKYTTRKVRDWQSKLDRLPYLFDQMAGGRNVDPSRPSLEFYRSESELVLYLPVNP